MLKAVVCGSCGVGKTNTVNRIQGKPFLAVYKSTCGVDCSSSDVAFADNEREVKLMIWDTTGNREQAALGAPFYQGADVIILMFDITNEESFNDLDTIWMKLVRDSIYPNIIPSDKSLIVVGNKTDLEVQRKVANTDGKEFAETIGASFLETSAKTGHNVDVLLKHLNSHHLHGEVLLL